MKELLRKSFSEYLKILKDISKHLLETLRFEIKHGDDLSKFGVYLLIFLGLSLLMLSPLTFGYIILMMLLTLYIITLLITMED